VLSVDVVCCFETRVTPHVSESCTKRTCFSHARHWWARSSEGFSRGGGFYFTNSKLREKQFSTKKQMTKYQISKPMGAVVPPSPPENFPETSSVEPRFNPKSSNRPAARLLKRYRDGRGVTRGSAKGAHCFGRRKVPTMWYVLPSIQYICSKRPQIRTWGPRPASCPGPHLNSVCPCEKDLKKTFTAAIKHSSLNNAPIRASLLCLRVFFQHVSMATVSCSAR